MTLLGACLCVCGLLPQGSRDQGGDQGGDPGEARAIFLDANVLAEDGRSWRARTSVLVSGDRLASIGKEHEIRPASVVDVAVDLSGAFVVPGLIDLHTHLALHPYDEASWNDQVLKESLELRTIRAVRHARWTLEAGFTTVRELGTEGAGLTDVALREAIGSGLVTGPRILASTYAIVATGCYGPAGFDPRSDLVGGAQEVTGVDEMRRAVREQIHLGADWIKVYADYGRRPGEPATATFTLEELAAAVDEAQSAGKPVAAHASTQEGMLRAIQAGVRTIEHGSGASDLVLELMKDRGVVLCPTLAAAEAIARYAGWREGEPEPAQLALAKDCVRRARKLGVTIACGSDAGVFAHGANARELELLVDCGLTPAEALASATSVAARVLDREGDLGRLVEGGSADFVAFRRDPLAAVGALRSPILVVKDGRIVLDQRGR